MTTTFDVVGIGNAIVDVISPVDDNFLDLMGIEKGIMQLVERERGEMLYGAMKDRVQAPGGSVANTLAGLGNLGLSTGFIGRVHDDALGRFYARSMAEGGTDFVNAPVPGGELPTSRSMIFVSPDGERSMNTYLGISSELGPDDVADTVAGGTRLLFLEGYLYDKPKGKEAFERAAKLCRDGGGRAGIALSDPFCVDRHRADFRRLVQDLDYVIGNEHEWESLYQTDLSAALEQAARDAGLVVLHPLGRGCDPGARRGNRACAGAQNHSRRCHGGGRSIRRWFPLRLCHRAIPGNRRPYGLRRRRRGDQPLWCAARDQPERPVPQRRADLTGPLPPPVSLPINAPERASDPGVAKNAFVRARTRCLSWSRSTRHGNPGKTGGLPGRQNPVPRTLRDHLRLMEAVDRSDSIQPCAERRPMGGLPAPCDGQSSSPPDGSERTRRPIMSIPRRKPAARGLPILRHETGPVEPVGAKKTKPRHSGAMSDHRRLKKAANPSCPSLTSAEGRLKDALPAPCTMFPAPRQFKKAPPPDHVGAAPNGLQQRRQPLTPRHARPPPPDESRGSSKFNPAMSRWSAGGQHAPVLRDSQGSPPSDGSKRPRRPITSMPRRTTYGKEDSPLLTVRGHLHLTKAVDPSCSILPCAEGRPMDAMLMSCAIVRARPQPTVQKDPAARPCRCRAERPTARKIASPHHARPSPHDGGCRSSLPDPAKCRRAADRRGAPVPHVAPFPCPPVQKATPTRRFQCRAERPAARATPPRRQTGTTPPGAPREKCPNINRFLAESSKDEGWQGGVNLARGVKKAFTAKPPAMPYPTPTKSQTIKGMVRTAAMVCAVMIPAISVPSPPNCRVRT